MGCSITKRYGMIYKVCLKNKKNWPYEGNDPGTAAMLRILSVVEWNELVG